MHDLHVSLIKKHDLSEKAVALDKPLSASIISEQDVWCVDNTPDALSLVPCFKLLVHATMSNKT